MLDSGEALLSVFKDQKQIQASNQAQNSSLTQVIFFSD